MRDLVALIARGLVREPGRVRVREHAERRPERARAVGRPRRPRAGDRARGPHRLRAAHAGRGAREAAAARPARWRSSTDGGLPRARARRPRGEAAGTPRRGGRRAASPTGPTASRRCARAFAAGAARRAAGDARRARLAPQGPLRAQARGRRLDRRRRDAARPRAAHPRGRARGAARGLVLPPPARGPAAWSTSRASRSACVADVLETGARARACSWCAAPRARRCCPSPTRSSRRSTSPRGALVVDAAGVRRVRIDVVTIFPRMLEAPLSDGIVQRAREAGLVEIRAARPARLHGRPPPQRRRRAVRRRPGHGDEGRSRSSARSSRCRGGAAGRAHGAAVVLLSPRGRRFDQQTARRYAGLERLVLLCGRYEGIDERVARAARDRGAEPRRLRADRRRDGRAGRHRGDACGCCRAPSGTRARPSATPSRTACWTGPHYTRPAEWRGHAVPEVLLSGDHGRDPPLAAQAGAARHARAPSRPARPGAAGGRGRGGCCARSRTRPGPADPGRWTKRPPYYTNRDGKGP